MKDVAIVGLPSSGKSTVFTAVTRHAAHPGSNEATVAVLGVPDERLLALGELFGSAKVTHAQVRLIDVPGIGPQGLGSARASDALAIVLRAFGADADPVRDLSSFRAELAVADLATVEKVRERVAKRANAGDKDSATQLAACDHAEAVLSADRWLSEEEWPDDLKRVVELWTPLTLKPVLHVVNADESGAEPGGVPDPVIVVRGLLEAEAADLPEDDAAALLKEFGLDEPASDRFVRAAYDAMSLVTFFTGNEVDARAWTVPAGARAPQAAGAIHSDFEKGFIRAECVAFADLMDAGSMEEAKKRGRVRVEGKDYEVHEGDYLAIRHS